MQDRQESEGRFTLPARLATGVVQGLLLYALVKVKDDAPLFGLDADLWKRLLGTMRLFTLYAPLPLLFGYGNLPLRKLAPWAAMAAAAVFAFGWFAAAPAWRNAPTTAWLFALIVIYILHEFVQAAHDDKRRIASYETYFERSWRHGFQAVLSIGFVIAFWIVISLGATLFRLIGLEIVPRAIFSDFFRCVSSPVAFALAIQLTDRNAGLTRGARQIGLALLSWLAVLMTLILAAFLVALPFTGLEPLWDTKRATVLLLNAAATMILLINAAYQAGDPPPSKILCAIVRFSALPLAGVVGLAALGLYLRVNQYGFTPARVLAGAELSIVAVYAAGYLAAALKPGAWLDFIRPVNIAAALFVAAVLSALMTPVLDPARVAVADQVSRLDRGAVEPDDFDFSFLADNRSGHWGEAALARLAARKGSERDDRIALLAKNPAERSLYGGPEQTFSDRRAALTLLGSGAIPDAALLPRTGDDPVSTCVSSMKAFADEEAREAERARQRARLGERAPETAQEAEARRRADQQSKYEPDPDEGRCLARMIDADFDGDDDLLILMNDRWIGGAMRIAALINDGDHWTNAGTVNGVVPVVDAGDNQPSSPARRRAAFEAATFAPHPWADITTGGARLRVDSVEPPRDLDRARIEALDGAEAPAAAFKAAHNYDAGQFCHNGCFGKTIAVAADGAQSYAVIAVRYDGSVDVSLFDPEKGAYVARASGSPDDFDDGRNIADDKQRGEHLKSEYRRLATTLSTAPPLIGDLIAGGTRSSFVYPERLRAAIAERR